MFINNHTAIWGSWYDKTTSRWGFACCHSFIHMSYCAGDAGIQAADSSSALNLLRADADRQVAVSTPETPAETGSSNKPIDNGWLTKKRVGEGEVALDQSKLQAALREERERKKRHRGDDEEGDARDKRRKYNSFSGGQDVTEEGACRTLSLLVLGMRRPCFTHALLFLQCRNGSLPHGQSLCGRSYGKLP